MSVEGLYRVRCDKCRDWFADEDGGVEYFKSQTAAIDEAKKHKWLVNQGRYGIDICVKCQDNPPEDKRGFPE